MFISRYHSASPESRFSVSIGAPVTLSGSFDVSCDPPIRLSSTACSRTRVHTELVGAEPFGMGWQRAIGCDLATPVVPAFDGTETSDRTQVASLGVIGRTRRSIYRRDFRSLPTRPTAKRISSRVLRGKAARVAAPTRRRCSHQRYVRPSPLVFSILQSVSVGLAKRQLRSTGRSFRRKSSAHRVAGGMRASLPRARGQIHRFSKFTGSGARWPAALASMEPIPLMAVTASEDGKTPVRSEYSDHEGTAKWLVACGRSNQS